MNEETQKFLALEGLRSWANAVVLQVERMQSSRDALLELRGLDSQWIKRMGQFRSDRHLFLVSAWKLIEHMDWADKLGCLENNNFSEIQEMRKDIKEMRDMNEHVLEYFLGDGRRQHAWVYKDENGSTDASSTLGTKIGGRLDWVVLEAAVKRLLPQWNCCDRHRRLSPRTQRANMTRYKGRQGAKAAQFCHVL